MDILIWTGLLILYLLIGTFLLSIIDSATAGDIDSIWIMLLWPALMIGGVFALIILGIIKAGQFIGDIIYDKLN